MSKHTRNLLIAMAFVFVTPFSHADVSDESIDQLIVLSGLQTQIDQFPALIKDGMEQAKQQGSPIPEPRFRLLVKSVEESISPETIIEEIRVSLKESILEDEAKELLTWFESDIGKSITRAEERASTPEAVQEMMQSGQSLLRKTELVKFAKRLDALLGSTEMTMDLQKHSGIAVYSALVTAMRPTAPLDIEMITKQVEEANSQTRPVIEQMITASIVYTYQNIETNDLTQYEEFLNTPAATKFHKVSLDSMNTAIQASISKFAETFAKLIKGGIKES